MNQLALFGPGGDGKYVCPACGTFSPNRFVHNLNHTIIPGSRHCGAQRLAIDHVHAAYKYPEFTHTLEANLARAHQLGLTETDYGRTAWLERMNDPS